VVGKCFDRPHGVSGKDKYRFFCASVDFFVGDYGRIAAGDRLFNTLKGYFDQWYDHNL
jgi:hypothetical protein